MERLENWQLETADDIGPKLTCDETEDLARLFTSVGRADLASALIEGHTATDEPTDAHYPDRAEAQS
jgi:hypothetical protein